MKWELRLRMMGEFVVRVDDPAYLVEDVEQSIKWFCDMTVEPEPLDAESKDKILQRMMNIGWLRRSEYETYKQLTKPEDD